MKRILIYICLLCAALWSSANEITILPQFAVGDIIRYRTTAQVIMYHGKDSLVSTTKMLPTLVVEAKNDRGFIITTTNKLEYFKAIIY